jgi:flavin-dependent dehydrogenase
VTPLAVDPVAADRGDKITPRHRERRADVYVRQSTLQQVEHHRESRANQYALVQRALALGWPRERVHVVDADLGQSGHDGSRSGFQGLVAAVSLGQVGLVLAYVFPSDGGLACLALSANLDGYGRLRRAPEAVLTERLAARPGLATRVARAVPDGRAIGCGPEASYVRVPGGPGWALVGDAGLHLDPWTGNGMDFAATQAEMLAESLDDWFAGRASEADALAVYRARRDEYCLPIYDRTIAGARDLRQTKMMDLVRETRMAAGLDPEPAVARPSVPRATAALAG